jgi:hypothetical protein
MSQLIDYGLQLKGGDSIEEGAALGRAELVIDHEAGR